jgi:DNA mismatch repair protein MutL
MPIRILSCEVVSKIAAGEVVDRPAAVVKELAENSLDAGATQISVEAQDGGVRLIRVTDNGSGIPANEAERAFHRYATSKIETETDLEKIATLGFRGEALPSIAAAAEVEILTRDDADAAATYLYLKSSNVTKSDKRTRPQGTTVTVHQLFRHVPARLKFMKSATTESGHIANLLSQYALAFPEVRFNLVIDGRLTLQTSGNGSLRDAVAEVYGPEIARQMLEIDENDPVPGVSGLVSPPSLSRSSRSYLSFFVNRRCVHSSLLARATEDAYHGLLMTGKHPIAVLNISMPPHELDVNVHPTKRDVKFRNTQVVYSAVQKAIQKVLVKAPVPGVKAGAPEAAQPVSLWTVKGAETFSLPILRVVGQLASNYIMAEGPEGLYLIDQHAAHERVLFEKILDQRSRSQVEIQGLLEPLTLELTPKQEEVLKNKSELLGEFGFRLEHFGGRTYLLKAVPAIAVEGDLSASVTEMLDSIAGEEEPAKRDEKIAQSVACHSAVKAGHTLSTEEMRELIKQLEQTKQPRTCPHGRPTMIHLSSHQLEKEFGRTG